MYVSANEAALYYCIIVKYLSFVVVYVNDIILMYNILIYMVRKIIVIYMYDKYMW